MNKLVAIVICVWLIVGILSVMIRPVLTKSQSTGSVDPYCEMVQLSIDTSGDLGWPDFRNTYMTECVK